MKCTYRDGKSECGEPYYKTCHSDQLCEKHYKICRLITQTIPLVTCIIIFCFFLWLALHRHTDRDPIHQSSGRLVGWEVYFDRTDGGEDYMGDVLFRKGFGFYPSIENE